MLDSVDIKWREMFTYTCFSHKTFKLLTLEYFCIKLKFKDNSTSFSEYILQVKYKLLETKFKWNMSYKLHIIGLEEVSIQIEIFPARVKCFWGEQSWWFLFCCSAWPSLGYR